MPRPQTAICADGETFAIFLTMMLAERGEATVRRLAAALPALTLDPVVCRGVPSLVSAIGFGASAWPRLFGGNPPAGLVPFAALSDGTRTAPATPADVLLHIHSESHDANFALARAVIERLTGAVTTVEEIHGYRRPGNRDLTGFIDGTENPKGDERPEAALVGDEQAEFAGGSYVSVQRFVHDLVRWERMPVAEQEAVIGRTKADDVEMDDEVKPPTAHIARVVIEEDGQELQILRHSLPYGTTGEHGLYFIAYGRSPHPFRRMLERMVLAGEDGHYDHLLDYTRPVTGAAFFVPSIDFLERFAEQGG